MPLFFQSHRNSSASIFIFAIILILTQALAAQEALLSTTENYFEFLALDGTLERPYLNYRTLSDSDWDTENLSGDIWSGNNLGSKTQLSDNFAFRIYGPELFTSYNSAAPYGQNDGALWQGKGFNTSLSAGARGEFSVGEAKIELTLKPVVYGSQNLAYDYVTPSSVYTAGENYADKAAEYGYFGVPYIDAPQRFGDDPLVGFSWGDSEIRFSWKTVTAGFGTQAIWLGPAKINPILMSNNAAPFPKADIGLRKTEIRMPWLGWDMGEVETRAFWGYLSESDWFDNDSTNDHNLLTGLTLSYAPPLADNLTFGFHRTMLSKWDTMDYESIFTLLWPFMKSSAGSDERDQRASITIESRFPSVGLGLYAEWARNDYSPRIDYIIRYPFHTQAYTVGMNKSIRFPFVHDLSGSLNVELTNLESSRDYELMRATTFYAHHIITQGYTNAGQYLGAGLGTGGNSQYVGLDIYSNKSVLNVFIQRTNPNLDYIWFLNSSDGLDEKRIRADLSYGIEFVYWVTQFLTLNPVLVFMDSSNYNYEPNPSSIHRYNLYAALAIKCLY